MPLLQCKVAASNMQHVIIKFKDLPDSIITLQEAFDYLADEHFPTDIATQDKIVNGLQDARAAGGIWHHYHAVENGTLTMNYFIEEFVLEHLQPMFDLFERAPEYDGYELVDISKEEMLEFAKVYKHTTAVSNKVWETMKRLGRVGNSVYYSNSG